MMPRWMPDAGPCLQMLCEYVHVMGNGPGGMSNGETVEVAPLAPQGEAVVQLPPGLASLRPRLPDGHAAVRTVNAVLAPETP